MKKLLILLALYGCEKASVQPTGAIPDYKQAAHSGNHFGNAMQNNDSAEAYADYFQFPPLFSDSIVYHVVNYNTGVMIYITNQIFIKLFYI